MGRALAWSVIALLIIVVAYFVIPWVTRLGIRARNKTALPPAGPPDREPYDREKEVEDLDGPDGPHNRPTV